MTDHNTYCTKCKKVLIRDEIAIYLRLVNRNAKEYLCIPCLAKHFKCSEQDIQVRIKRLKEMGCTLFS
jgi:biotin operon repressor